MKSHPNKFSSASGRQSSGFASERRSRTRGVALVITLILLALLGAASLAIVLLVSSDTMINGFYRNYRGSFYAADSGVSVAVEAMKTAVLNAANDTLDPPLPINGTIPAAVTNSYAAYQGGYYTFGDANSWRGQFTMIPNPSGAAVLGAPAVNSAQNPNDPNNPTDLIWTFSYPYTVTTKGQSAGTEGEEVTETGAIVYTSISGAAAAGGPPNFSKWAAFIMNFGDCQGPLVPGTMTGPFFTDGQWNFGNFANPGYTFTGSIAQVATKASWWNNNNCSDSAAPPNGFKKPSFPAGGLQEGMKKIVPPGDSYSQAQAVLDGKGAPPCIVTPCSPDPPPTQIQMNAELQTISGTAYPKTGSVPNGVYIPYYTSGTSPSGKSCTPSKPCYGGSTANGGDGYAGGFYVQGNASITLISSTGGDSTSNATQTYKITQGGTTTTIVVDNTAGTTTLTSGSTTLSLQGVPTQLDPNSGAVVTQTDPAGGIVNPTLVYVNGSITGLTGTYDSGNNPLPAIQNNTGVTIAASGNISITGDLIYAQLPVSIPADTLNTSTTAGVLGIYTNNNINLYPDPNGNLTVDASLAAIGSSAGTSGFATPGSNIKNWTIVGGRSEDQAHGVKIGSGNTYYDQRFANNFGPPWFPTAVPQAGQIAVPSSQSVSVTRAAWAEVNRD